ncbi:MerR family transcriptional regulator [bacterium]|nr:MerR family transcriptional regulator [bacterium]
MVSRGTSRVLEDRELEAFTAQQSCRLTGCTPHQLRYWDKVDLVRPSVQATGGRPGRRRLYSFRDLVALRVVRSLLDNGMSVQRVRRAWDYLRRTADMDTHLSEISLVTDGQSIFRVAHDEGELIDALREGQMAFFVAIDEIAREVEEDISRFELDRDQFLEMLQRVEEDISSEAAQG